MKYFLIGFVVWFMLAWFPQLVKTWIIDIRVWWKGKHAKRNEKWIYEVLK